MQSVQRGGGGGHGHYEEVREGLGWATDLHVQNFLEFVRTRKTPTATMKLGFQAVLVTQLGNLSLKNGQRMKWNTKLNNVEM
jgi:hypothetical protein